MIAWFAKNDVAANLLMAIIIMSGVYVLTNKIPLEIFPSIEPDSIQIQVSLRGATPEDAELALASKIEEAINDLEGIEEYTSRSGEGGSSVIVEVEDGYDPRELLNDIKSRVDAINTFPAEAEKPVISLAIRKRDVITVTVSGDIGEKELRDIAEQTREELLSIDGITQIDFDGTRNFEVSITLDADKLRQHDLTFAQIAQEVSRNSVDVSAGELKTPAGDILLRSKGQAYQKDDFESIPIKSHSDGSLLLLKDLAQINDGFEEREMRTSFNDRMALEVRVFRVGNQSAIAIADEVKAYVAQKQAELPETVFIDYWDDDSLKIKSRIKTLTTNAFQGGLLVILLLSLFLRPAVAFWVFLGIPISFLGAFCVLPFIGISINMISLFAFIVVLGIVVDDAIVTGENIYTHLQKSEDGLQAAIAGTHEVAVPVTFGVLTTVVAFVPLLFLEGHRGPMFAQIPAVVIPCLLVSLIESKFILPAHLKKIRARNIKPSGGLSQWQQNFSSGFERLILKRYQPFLALCLKYRYPTLLLFIGVLMISVVTLIWGHKTFIFFPRIPSETVRFNVIMPTGTPFAVTDRYVQKATDAAEALKEKYVDDNGESVILNILSFTGESGGNVQGKVSFEVSPPEERSLSITSPEISREWRKMIGEIPGAETVTFRSEIGRSRDPIDIRLKSKDYRQLEQLSDQIKTRLRGYPTVFDVADSLADGKEEINIELKPLASILGLTRSDVIQQVRHAFYGFQAQRVQRGRDDVRVMVRYPLEQRESLLDLHDLLIKAPSGRAVPLNQVAEFNASIGPSRIIRVNGFRSINITADVEKENTNMTILRRDLLVYLDELVRAYPGVSYELAGEGKEQADTFSSLGVGILGVLFAIYCLLAIPFRSYVQPFLVMSVIPFAFIGAMLGHWLVGMSLTIMSVLGLVALVGVVVNDSLVLVDFINRKVKSHSDLLAAVSQAGAARFRPVMLTSLTTFIGLMPLLFESSTQAQFLKPMAVSLGFGILFATLITLLLVPINYLILDDIKLLMAGGKAKAKATPS